MVYKHKMKDSLINKRNIPLSTVREVMCRKRAIATITIWQCQPTEPGETSQISSEQSSRATATFAPSGLVERAATGDGLQLAEGELVL